ncbi:MAG TPA: type II secretion system F family protein [Geomonas sp.]|nr:type II secretion system F family protein [Geomonas sp.]
MITVIIVLTFTSLALLSGTVTYRLLSRGSELQARLDKLMPREEKKHVTLLHTPAKWQVMLADLGQKLKVKPSELLTYRETVVAAGFRPERVYVFLGSKLLLAVLLPGLFLFLYAVPHGQLSHANTLLLAIALAIFGYLAPSFWLDRRASWRKEAIFHSLPDVLDLLTVCVEAGLSLDAALIRTIDNFEHQDDPLILELNQVILEINAGRPRMEALKGVAERTMVDDVRSFVSMIVQTEKFGTGLGKTLRTYSDSLRIKRRQFAEERAAKTAVKMIFPLTFCVFPALLVVLLAPALVKIYDVFKH